jgi:nuclear transport factor 2 (NTF2) superfamily protein
VHLSSPPFESHFWRSHTAGSKCLSTIEAIYYAILETDNNENYIHLMWLFALQRAAIQAQGLWKDRKGLPFTEVGKEEQRAYRRQKDEVAGNNNELYLHMK